VWRRNFGLHVTSLQSRLLIRSCIGCFFQEILMNPYKPDRSTRPSRALAISCSVVLLTALAACGKKNDDQTVGQKLDTAVARTEQAATEAKARAETSMGKAQDAMKDATAKAEASGKSTADKVATTMDDVSITTAVSAAFVRDPDLSALKIDVDTKNGRVTLTGPAPTMAAKEKATTLAKAIKGVMSVDNKLVVKTG
jgi:hyperosmotically inducible periplasmic protein